MISRKYSSEHKSYLIPLRMLIFFIPSIALAFRSKLINRALLLFNVLHPRQAFSQFMQSIPYIFAEGPPRSSMFPLKCGSLVIFSISFNIDFSEREIILFALSLNSQILYYRDELNKEVLGRYEEQIYSIFKNSLQNAVSKNKSFLFFVEELEAKLLLNQKV
jgi:hypothetical protein